MPTNEERREIAARLRKLSNDALKEKKKNACELSQAVSERCDAFCTNYACWSGTLNHLADLIDPEPERTCVFEPEIKDYDYDDDGNEIETDDPAENCDCFECSKCGYPMLYDVNEWYDGGWFDLEPPYSPHFKYCPNCGAKVVENDN